MLRPAVVVFGAISAIAVALIRYIKAALKRFAVKETLSRFENVIAGKFAADFTEKLHAMMKERTAYDNLPVKQLCPEVPSRNTRDLLLGPITRQPSARSNRKRICLSGNHGQRHLGYARHSRNLDPSGLIEEPRPPIDFDEQIMERRKRVQWKRELAGKWMAPVTADANAAIRRAIQHFKIARAAGKTDLARAFPPKGAATQNEKLAPVHTKRLDRKAKIDIEVVACSRNGMNGSIAPDNGLPFDTKKTLRPRGVSKKTSPRQFDLRLMAGNCVAFCGDFPFGW